MDRVRARIQSSARARGENIQYITSAKEPAYGYNRQDIYLSISHTHFDVYKINETISIKAYSWFTISRIQLKDNSLYLEFGDYKSSFQSTDMPEAFKIICDILSMILKPLELLNIGLSEKDLTQFPTSSSIILRLQQKSKNVAASDKLLKIITEKLRYGSPEINLIEFPDPKVTIPLFIDILPLISTISTVIIPVTSTIDGYKYAADIINDPGNLQHIQIDGSPTISFERFLRAYTKSCSIVAVSFTNAQFSEKQLSQILDTIHDKDLTSICLRNSIQMKAMTYFYFTFLSNSFVKNLSAMSIEKAPGMNLYALLPAVSNLAVLSLQDCSLDLNKTLQMFSKTRFTNLRALNLSQNVSKEMIKTDISLPPSLTSLMVDSIDWSDNCLISLMKMITFNKRQGLRLSIGHSAATKGEWGRTFNYLKTTLIEGLEALVWDENPICPAFFDFLSKQKLKYLSIGSCIGEDDTDYADSLVVYLHSAVTLKSLAVWGNDDAFMGETLGPIIQTLKTRPALSFLDVSGSKGGDVILDSLRGLVLSDRSPKTIVFDGAEPERGKAMLDLLNSAGSKVELSFPVKDLDYLVRLKRISEAQFTDIRAKFSYQESDASLFNPPFSVYREVPTYAFPRFLPRGEILLKKAALTVQAPPPIVVTSPKRETRIRRDSDEPRTVEGEPSKRLFEMNTRDPVFVKPAHQITVHVGARTLDPDDPPYIPPKKRLRKSDITKRREIERKEERSKSSPKGKAKLEISASSMLSDAVKSEQKIRSAANSEQHSNADLSMRNITPSMAVVGGLSIRSSSRQSFSQESDSFQFERFSKSTSTSQQSKSQSKSKSKSKSRSRSSHSSERSGSLFSESKRSRSRSSLIPELKRVDYFDSSDSSTIEDDPRKLENVGRLEVTKSLTKFFPAKAKQLPPAPKNHFSILEPDVTSDSSITPPQNDRGHTDGQNASVVRALPVVEIKVRPPEPGQVRTSPRRSPTRQNERVVFLRDDESHSLPQLPNDEIERRSQTRSDPLMPKSDTVKIPIVSSAPALGPNATERRRVPAPTLDINKKLSIDESTDSNDFQPIPVDQKRSGEKRKTRRRAKKKPRRNPFAAAENINWRFPIDSDRESYDDMWWELDRSFSLDETLRIVQRTPHESYTGDR